jgi:hypothetical protein
MAAPKAINGQPARYFANPPTWSDGESGPILVDQFGRVQFAVGALATGKTYTITGDTPTRTLTVATASATDVANVLATALRDLGLVGQFTIN